MERPPPTIILHPRPDTTSEVMSRFLSVADAFRYSGCRGLVILSTQSRTFPFPSMGSFGVRRSGSSPQGDGSCGERCTSCGRPQTRDSAHFSGIPQLTALEHWLRGKRMPRNAEQPWTGKQLLGGEFGGPGGSFRWCVPYAPTANRTALPTQDWRPRRAVDAPGPKVVRPQLPRILGGWFRQHERASDAAAWPAFLPT